MMVGSKIKSSIIFPALVRSQSCCRLLPLIAQDLVCLDVKHSEAHLEQIYAEMGSLKICENATDQLTPDDPGISRYDET